MGSEGGTHLTGQGADTTAETGAGCKGEGEGQQELVGREWPLANKHDCEQWMTLSVHCSNPVVPCAAGRLGTT
jgi:hypothetical protein